jgi:Sec-independent protein translocase protein TatA
MDTLCGIGLPELIILALLGFVVVGPERSREVAVSVGRWLGKAMRSPWWQELGDVTQALRDLPTTLVRMAQLEDAQADLQATLQDIEHQTTVEFNLGEEPQESDTEGEKPVIANPWGIESSGETSEDEGESKENAE